MSKEEKEAMEFTKSVLDSIDIKGLAGNKEYEIGDIMCLIDEAYCQQYANNKYMEGCIFNWFNEDDFKYYLKLRYGNIKVSEITHTYITI